MKYSTQQAPNPFMDARADTDDQIAVRIGPSITGGKTLYIDVNGITIIRIVGIDREVEVYQNGFDEVLVEAFISDIRAGANPLELRPFLTQAASIEALDEAVRRLDASREKGD